MRTNAAAFGPISVDDYLRMEESSEVRHEFVAGRLYEMFGTTARHNQIVLNIFKRLDALTVDRPCRAYVAELKVRAASDRIYYPDLVMVCTAHAPETVMFDAPCFIVEVTSKSTRRIDRGEKHDAYVNLPSLRGYLVVEQDRRNATLYERTDGGWSCDEIMTSGTMRVPCAGGELSIEEIYAGVEVPNRVRENDVWAMASYADDE